MAYHRLIIFDGRRTNTRPPPPAPRAARGVCVVSGKRPRRLYRRRRRRDDVFSNVLFIPRVWFLFEQGSRCIARTLRARIDLAVRRPLRLLWSGPPQAALSSLGGCEPRHPVAPSCVTPAAVMLNPLT